MDKALLNGGVAETLRHMMSHAWISVNPGHQPQIVNGWMTVNF